MPIGLGCHTNITKTRVAAEMWQPMRYIAPRRPQPRQVEELAPNKGSARGQPSQNTWARGPGQAGPGQPKYL